IGLKVYGARTISLAPLPATVVPGQPITLTATVKATGSSTKKPGGRIEFRDSGKRIALVDLNASGVATYKTSALEIGRHVFDAVYSGDTAYAGGTSSEKTVTMNPRIGPEFTVNTFKGSASSTKQRPAIARLSDNGFVVVWESTGQD